MITRSKLLQSYENQNNELKKQMLNLKQSLENSVKEKQNLEYEINKIKERHSNIINVFINQIETLEMNEYYYKKQLEKYKNLSSFDIINKDELKPNIIVDNEERARNVISSCPYNIFRL